MEIHDFDIKKGIYSFEFGELNTESHSHPVVEIISATNGTFSLQSNGQINKNLVFAIIDSNIEHKVFSKDCSIRMLMIESHNLKLTDFLGNKGIKFKNGVFSKTNIVNKNELFSEVKNLAITIDLKTPTDKRIVESIKFIEENELEYKDLISELTSKVFLSNSRLSHLFKEHIGISIKKYLVWNRLRQAINLYLSKNTNLTDVSIQSGFFDQAHFTNSFKTVLGVSPSKAYNSRILQS
ncbi:AraC family transcriptional regulator [Flammeovirga sp. EKP202]|uniref:helix-turn-helix domain-containing protein n=1 Tax=Flammeovirga sp. EKP202 TaxID=2770592 RepID=UPI00165FDB43|nr:AraC family transcriptional regulator [Flammeovirga sp. EKP202]MBD0404632.1 helix-turn-helix transcriptional regulator [Flammeovirga sp. EKP202]